MFCRYESKWARFSQPDPYDGSYDLTDPQSFNRYSYTQNDPVNFVDPSGLCSFTVALDNQANLTQPQLDAMQNRIRDIFAAAGQGINFVAARTPGADYNLTIFSSVAGRREGATTVGSTDLAAGPGSAVRNVGRVYVDRLTASATGDTIGRVMYNLDPDVALGKGLGTAGAHEIGHFLLQQNSHSLAIPGIMTAGFFGVQWFGAIRTFTAAQIMRLNSLCSPVSTDTSIPSTITLPQRPLIPLNGPTPRSEGQFFDWLLDWFNNREIERPSDNNEPV